MAKTVRGYLRGLDILQALSERRIATAAELAQDTDLPRPTVHRMLGTLVEAGFANQIGGSQDYALTQKTADLSHGYDATARALEIAEPMVAELSARMNWPCFLHSVNDEAVVTRVVVRSPRSLGYPKPGGHLPMAHFSPGRAHLASLEDDALDAQISQFSEEQSGRYAEGLTQESLHTLVMQARARGFGFRENGVVPRTGSFAVPIRMDGTPVLYLTTKVILSTIPLFKAADDCMPMVMDTVAAIEAAGTPAPSQTLH